MQNQSAAWGRLKGRCFRPGVYSTAPVPATKHTPSTPHRCLHRCHPEVTNPTFVTSLLSREAVVTWLVFIIHVKAVCQTDYDTTPMMHLGEIKLQA